MADPTIQIIIDAYTRGLQDGMKRAENSVKTASASMTARLADINQAALLVRRTFNDVVGIVRRVYELGKEGAQLQDVERRFYRLVGGAEAAEAILVKLRAATKGMVTDAELMDNALRLMSSGLARTGDDLEIIMRTVPALGQQMKGFAADRSLLSYTFMIANGLQAVRMRADDFGISVITVEARMKELEAQGLDTRDALQQAVNEELVRVYNDLGLAAKTAATEMAAHEAALKNATDAIKKDLIPLTMQWSEGWSALAGVGGPIHALIDALGHWLAGLSGFVVGLGDAAKIAIATYHAMAAASRGDTAEIQKQWQTVTGIMATTAERAERETARYYLNWARWTQTASDDIGKNLGDVGAAVDDTAQKHAEASTKIHDAMDEVAKAWERALVANARRTADYALAELRRIEDQEIATARQMEDMGRQLTASIAHARAQAAKAEAATARDYAERRLEIERDYQKRLRDIQAEYEETAADAIARRDALALVRAQRQRDRELQEAEEQRNEQRRRARRDYEERLRDLHDSLAEQIAAAQEAYRQQEEDLQRSLERQEEDARLAQQRREQDQAIALAREREDLARALFNKVRALTAHYRLIENMYMTHLARMRMINQVFGGVGMGGTLGSYQQGTPYVPVTGTYRLEEGEAVIPARENVLRPVSVYGGGGGSVAAGRTIRVEQNNWNFYGSFTEGDREWFRKAAREETLTALGEMIDGVH